MRTAVATATVFVPGCLKIAREIERSLSYQAAVLSFSTPSTTRPMSERRTGEPFLYVTTTGRYAEASSNWPLAWTVKAVSGP